MDAFIPIPKTRNGAIVLLSILIVLCLIASIVVYFLWSHDQSILKEKGQPDFNGLSMEELKDGLIVKGSIDMLIDTYAEEYETEFGVRTSDESEQIYYIFPVYDADQAGNINIQYLMTYEAEPEDFDTLNKIGEQTWNGSPGQTVFAVPNGQILNLPGDIKKLLNKWMDDPGFYENGSFIDWCVESNVFGTGDRETIKSKIAPYMVIKTETAGTDIGVLWVFAGIAGFCIIVLVIVIFSDKARSRKKREEINIYRNEWDE